MSEQGWEQLTLFQEDSPASRSLLPGSSDQRMTTATSGLRCLELYKKSGPVGSLLRMCLESSVWRSTRCYLSWKPSATPAKRLLFRLVPSMPRTDGTESSLWPTMTAGVHGKKRYAQGGKPLTMAIAEKFGEEVTLTPEFAEWLMGYEQEFTKLLPTPVASDSKGASANRFYTHKTRYRHQLSELVELTPYGKLGRLNPTWVEWLMGYPIGWTDLSASETP